jgi:lysophospholipase L1-like esterase
MTHTLAFRRIATLSALALTATVVCSPLWAQSRNPSAAVGGAGKVVEAPKAVDPKAVDAKAVDPKAVDPKAVDPKCAVQPDIARFDQRLSRVALRLAGGVPIKIVAIGSSSTFGAGSSSPANSYPSRLEAALRRYFPDHPITVVNRGVNGEEATDMLARFPTNVIAEDPHLVIWQVGTNALLRDRPLDVRSKALQEGIAQLKSRRMDVVLMDPQYVPRVLAKADHEAAVAQIASIAKEQKIGLMHRYDMMRHWHDVERLAFETFVTSDGLHMNDWGYSCLATSLGVAIADAATRPTETAVLPAVKR